MVNYLIAKLLNCISYFIFIYPLFMCIVWTSGGIFYYKNYEKKKSKLKTNIDEYPPITILIPCHNEGNTIEETCKNVRTLNYLDYNVIFIDDASTDNTVDILRKYTATTPFFNIILLDKNKGKAGALNTALYHVKTPYVLIIDADTILERDALKYFLEPFSYKETIAAVTGNPLPSNRTNFLSKLQTAEFMSIIGLIKRCQCFLGKIFTVSGCATMYKTTILIDVGGFSKLTATEDIDVTWRIQRKLYDIWFQSKAIVYIQVPTKFKEYFKQRKRWTMGGWHLLRTHKGIFRDRNLIKLWLIYIEATISCLWSFCFISSLLVISIKMFLSGFGTSELFALSTTSILAITCIIQMGIAVYINASYDDELKDVFFWVPWYPLLFFFVGSFLVVITSVKGLFGTLENSGKWKSPKREVIN